jgi:uncharacterized membrane protein
MPKNLKRATHIKRIEHQVELVPEIKKTSRRQTKHQMRADDEVQTPRADDEVQTPRADDEVQAPCTDDEVQTCSGCDHDSTGADAQAPMDWHTNFPPCKWICEPCHGNAQQPSHMHETWCISYYDSE